MPDVTRIDPDISARSDTDVSGAAVSASTDAHVSATSAPPSPQGFRPLRVHQSFACTIVELAGVRIPLRTPHVTVILMATLFTSACGIAPVTSTPAPPPTVAYVNPHGRPRAFGGGVCPVSGRHEHIYPPVPDAFFVDDAGAWRDTRPIGSFTGPHPWRRRRCGIARYHQHAINPGDLEPG